MADSTFASPEWAHALLDGSDEVVDEELSDRHVLGVLGVPGELLGYIRNLDGSGCVTREGLALETLRDLRDRPRACVNDPQNVLRLAKAGHQALDFAASDPWLRFTLGLAYMAQVDVERGRVEAHLRLFDMSESDSAARGYMTAHTGEPWALYMASSWVLSRLSLRELWSALLCPQSDAAKMTSYAIFAKLRYTRVCCTLSWSEHVQSCALYVRSGGRSWVRDAMLTDTDHPDSAESWCLGILGRALDLPRAWSLMRTHLAFGGVQLPGDTEPVWTIRYILWMAEMADATTSLIRRSPTTPSRLPCPRGSDPEAAQVVAFGKQMMQWADEEAKMRRAAEAQSH